MPDNRGVILDRGYANQVKDYSGLRFGKITPTDIDGLIEYQGKGYVFIEVKYLDTLMPRGQQVALERLCDDLEKAKPTLLIICQHSEATADIDVGQTRVRRYRSRGEWRETKKSTRDLIESFIESRCLRRVG